jgi:RNA polymerase sigma-70 factor (ECF subfamily)
VRDVNAEAKLDEAAVGRIFREESGRSVAALIRVFGDIAVAEDALQEAFAVALRKWPGDGLPPNPGGWITTTARNRAIDRLRRESRGRELLRGVAVLAPGTGGPGALEKEGPPAGRPASPHLHLLPPGTLHGSAGGAHPPTARRPLDS